MSVRLSICGALFCALLLSACGGEGDGAVDPAFVKQADGVCAKVNRKASDEILAAYDLWKVKKSANEAEAIKLEATLFTPILLRAARALSSEMESLPAADGNSDQVQALGDAYRAWIEKAERSPGRVIVANDIYNEARRISGDYGLSKCELTPYQYAE